MAHREGEGGRGQTLTAGPRRNSRISASGGMFVMHRVRTCLALVAAALVVSFSTSTASQTPGALPLLQSSSLSDLGTFRLPREGLEYGGGAVAFNAARNSLFLVGWNDGYAVGEYTIPAVGAVARNLQPLTDAWEGKRGQIGVSDSRIGGLLVFGDRLISSVYAYYDATRSQTLSHFVRPLALRTAGHVAGPVRVGTQHGAGYYAGYMTHVPAVWQGPLGATAVTGLCCVPIISRTSYGPALFGFDPATMKVTTQLQWYDREHPLRPYAGKGPPEPLFNGTTRVNGVVIVGEARTALFLGESGIGPRAYGNGAEHADPIVGFAWAYDLNDLVMVKNGKREPWSVQPYATWQLPFRVQGATYDPAARRIYAVEARGDGAFPVVHAIQVTAPAAVAPPALPRR